MLSVSASKKLLSQQLPRAQVTALLENMNLGEKFAARVDEVTLPLLMCSVANATLKLFEHSLLKSVPHAVYHNPAEAKEKKEEEGDHDEHGAQAVDRIKLKVAPVKKGERIAAKIREYREEKGVGGFPYCQFVTDILRASFICETADDMLEAFKGVCSSGAFKLIRLKNKMSEGQAPYNLHANCLFHPKCCPEPIVIEIQFYIRAVYELQHRQHLAYELRRAALVQDVVMKTVTAPRPPEVASKGNARIRGNRRSRGTNRRSREQQQKQKQKQKQK
jgi:hypothetical protein